MCHAFVYVLSDDQLHTHQFVLEAHWTNANDAHTHQRAHLPYHLNAQQAYTHHADTYHTYLNDYQTYAQHICPSMHTPTIRLGLFWCTPVLPAGMPSMYIPACQEQEC